MDGGIFCEELYCGEFFGFVEGFIVEIFLICEFFCFAGSFRFVEIALFCEKF